MASRQTKSHTRLTKIPKFISKISNKSKSSKKLSKVDKNKKKKKNNKKKQTKITKPKIKNASIHCKECGGICSIPIYRKYAKTYKNKAISQKHNNKPLSLDILDEKYDIDIDNDDDNNNNNDNNISQSMPNILSAKQKYLRIHHSTNTSYKLTCNWPHCKVLRKSKASNISSINNKLSSFTEIEAAHLIFAHSGEWNKRFYNNRQKIRSGHYVYTINNKQNDYSQKKITAKLSQIKQTSLLAFDLSKSNHNTDNDNDNTDTNPSVLSLTDNNPSTLNPATTLKMPALKYTKSVYYQKLLVRNHKKRVIPKDVLLFGYEFQANKGKWKNPKEEVLKNTLLKAINCTIRPSEWNNLLKSSARYVRMRESKIMKLSIKEVVGLKLYTDFDELQRQFRKCFRIEDKVKRLKIQKEFYHWNKLLVAACKKSREIIKIKVYHGVSSLTKTSTFNGKYWGPVSTTSVLEVAKQFSGQKGSVLELQSSYNIPGMRLNWLSNYPDEDEILYMNTTFEIVDIIDPLTSKTKLIIPTTIIDDIDNDFNDISSFQQSITSSLQKMSVNSNVITLNNIAARPAASTGFASLADNDKISVLKLLYYQYEPARWNSICNNHTSIAVSLNKSRDQFIEIINAVCAVEMDCISPLLQDFFSADQSKYIFPIKNMKNIINELNEFHLKFQNEPKNLHFFKFQTIIRLFPEAEQISINSDNWDWSLNEFVKFLKKWQYDYAAVPISFIDIKFKKQTILVNDIDDNKDNKDTDDTQKAIKLLEDNNATGNIRKLLKLGWKFLTPCKLTRVPFQPPLELPFLLTFIKKKQLNNNKKHSSATAIFHKTYTQNLLQRAASHKSVEGFGIDNNDNDANDPDDIIIEGSIPSTNLASNASNVSNVSNVSEPGSRKTSLGNSLCNDLGVDTDADADPDIPLFGGDNMDYTEIDHNPKICILTKEIFTKIYYGSDLKKMLSKTKYQSLVVDPGGNYNDNCIINSFNDACCDVRTLVLDPLPHELITIFCITKPVIMINYKYIYNIFKNVSDIFLRETIFTLDECKRLVTFLTELQQPNDDINDINDNSILSAYPFERIFYSEKKINNNNNNNDNPVAQLKKDTLLTGSGFVVNENIEYDDNSDLYDDNNTNNIINLNINNNQQNELELIMKELKTVGWCFQRNGQIAFAKDIVRHLTTLM